MAGIAFRSESAGVRILASMTAFAIARERCIQAPAAMTVGAINASMDALERKACFLRVVEPRGTPDRGAVARGAVHAALAAVHVVGRMT